MEHIGEFPFHDVKVKMYYEPSANPDKVAIGWRARNPDSFYQGHMFLNFETGKATYPEGAVIPEQTPRDREIMPTFILIGKPKLSDDEMIKIHERLESQHKKRNGLTNVRFCPDDCPHLSPNEAVQDTLAEKEDHICERYSERVKHGRHHPKLQRLDKCDLWD